MSNPQVTQYQAGYKLRDLKSFLTTVLGDKIAKRMTVEMQEVELILVSSFMGNGSFEIMTQRYKAELYFDRFPYQDYDPAVLFSNIGAWLMDNDSTREQQLSDLADPQIEVVQEDGHNAAEILVEISFEEPVKVIEDPQGAIYWRGQQYRIEEHEIWTATKLKDVVIL
ncbi:phage tail protein [uncultured Vibrio sp.]|uniref:phage tail protein n=1 Tax=uncultured Vibrio sp. TaxID=114054 RepID=UPI0025EAA88D|nr:phage tail protein [uncultured Vibrio sp.]